MWSKAFWLDGGERALKTAAQVAVSFLVIGTTGVLDVDWVQVASVSAVAALASILTSIASERVGDPKSASLVKSE